MDASSEQELEAFQDEGDDSALPFSLDFFYEFEASYCRVVADNPNMPEGARQECQDWLDYNTYKRPSKGWLARFVNLLLGPLPKDQQTVQPYSSRLDAMPSYRWQGFALMVVAISALLALVLFVPGMAISPLIVVSTLTEPLGFWGTIIVFVVAVIVINTAISSDGSKRLEGRFWARLAVREELWFRAGCEKWSWRQRITACAGFGLAHLANFIYPIASIIVIAVVGGVFMYTYLKAYKQSGSTDYAVLASTKLHAAYNRWAIVYMFIALAVVALASLAGKW